MSRRASPNRLNAKTAKAMANPGPTANPSPPVNSSWDAVLTMAPQDGASGGAPTPRKLRAASVAHSPSAHDDGYSNWQLYGGVRGRSAAVAVGGRC